MSGLAVVTGAAGAIGGAVAAALADAGHGLVLVARTEQSVAQLLGRHDGRCVAVDLGRAADLERACAELRRLERVDVVVHAAGRLRLGPVETFAAEELDELYQLNVRAPFRLTQALLPALRAASGELVFVNSSAATRAPIPSGGGYAATKHALRAIADAVRAEENSNGVRVLSVYPGRTAGPLQQRLHELEGKVYEPERLLQPADLAAAVMAALALPRTGEITDLHVRPMNKPRP